MRCGILRHDSFFGDRSGLSSPFKLLGLWSAPQCHIPRGRLVWLVLLILEICNVDSSQARVVRSTVLN